jgi:hypothetical protein
MTTIETARIRSRFHVAALVLALAAAPGFAAAGTPVNKRTSAEPDGTVEVSNTAGSVQVTGWDRNEVEVTGELGSGVEKLDFTKGPKRTRVAVIMKDRWRGGGDTKLVVRVPQGSTLAINTVSADLLVRDVQGTQRLQTVSGDLVSQGAAGDVEARTVSGDVRIVGTGRKGLTSITTVSGDVTASRLAGEVNGSTVSGTYQIDADEIARSRLRSTSGDVKLRGRLAPEARVELETISGDVKLEFVGEPPADYDISTLNGGIRTCFGPKPVRASEYGPGRELRFVEGAGTARVRIKTMNGDIDLCRR